MHREDPQAGEGCLTRLQTPAICAAHLVAHEDDIFFNTIDEMRQGLRVQCVMVHCHAHTMHEHDDCHVGNDGPAQVKKKKIKREIKILQNLRGGPNIIQCVGELAPHSI